ncbi:MAG: hypothetical protein WD227_04930 [Vicinamibacterales bacterium]
MNPSGAGDAAVAYEQLRHHVLTGSSRAGHVGLILLMREGVAAWLDHSPDGFTPAAPSTVAAVASPGRLPPLQAGIVAVLADLVWTTRQERNP